MDKRGAWFLHWFLVFLGDHHTPNMRAPQWQPTRQLDVGTPPSKGQHTWPNSRWQTRFGQPSTNLGRQQHINREINTTQHSTSGSWNIGAQTGSPVWQSLSRLCTTCCTTLFGVLPCLLVCRLDPFSIGRGSEAEFPNDLARSANRRESAEIGGFLRKSAGPKKAPIGGILRFSAGIGGLLRESAHIGENRRKYSVVLCRPNRLLSRPQMCQECLWLSPACSIGLWRVEGDVTGVSTSQSGGICNQGDEAEVGNLLTIAGAKKRDFNTQDQYRKGVMTSSPRYSLTKYSETPK